MRPCGELQMIVKRRGNILYTCSHTPTMILLLGLRIDTQNNILSSLQHEITKWD